MARCARVHESVGPREAAMSELRPLHLHSVDSVCADLVGGRAIGIGTDGSAFSLAKESSRAILNWYAKQRSKWGSPVQRNDVEAIADASTQKPREISRAAAISVANKLQLRLVKVEAHRFGGLHASTNAGKAPSTFVFAPAKPIMLLEGWNGSGKTSILNAVIWCLTGQLLRPQRKPEAADSEFECRIENDPRIDATYHKLTPVTPLPDRRYLPDLLKDKLPLDTWVELTFEDEDGGRLPPLRRTQTRTLRGAVNEVAPDLDALGIDPIAAQIGTTIPGILPFIQIGTVSELGQAIAQLTGLAELVNLARHAAKVKERLHGEFRRERQKEIDTQNDAFREVRSDLRAVIEQHPMLAPNDALPEPSSPNLEDAIRKLVAHFTQCQTRALKDAKLVLGSSFDPAVKAAREDLQNNVSPALAQLSEFGRLPSAARLRGLGNLTEDDIREAIDLVESIGEEAKILADLLASPDIGRRKQLYSRVTEWMKEHDWHDITACAVCGGTLKQALDPASGRLVVDEVREALVGDGELLSHTVESWTQSRLGRLQQALAAALASEMQKSGPARPGELLKTALKTELFEISPFEGSLAALQPSTAALADTAVDALPAMKAVVSVALPDSVAAKAKTLVTALNRVARGIAFARWQAAHKQAVNDAVMSVITKKKRGNDVVAESSPLGVKLVALKQIVEGAEPISNALTFCGRLARALKTRQEKESRIAIYDKAIDGLIDVIGLGALAERQVESLRVVLQDRAFHWRSRFYNNAYSASGHEFLGAEMDSKGAMRLLVGSPTVAAPAQHVSNASALRASLVGFFFAFWEHVFNLRGGFRLLLLDDPQELLDDDNRDRLARTIPEFVQAGAQIVLTTHSRSFARMVVAEGRKTQAVEHWSVHPVNANRATAIIALAVEEVDVKRQAFETNIDDAPKAQEYVGAMRTFVEARLGDLFDNAAYPAYAAPSKGATLSDFLGRLRGLVANGPNELFRRKVIKDFCDDSAVADGSSCLALLNKAHHKEKDTISYKDVRDEVDNLKRLRSLIEAIHEEFRRWKWRDATPSTIKTATLQPMKRPAFAVHVNPDLAAFTGAPGKGETQDAGSEMFDGTWFEGKSLFYLRNDNLGFAAPAGSIAVVESDSAAGNDRNLVIAKYREEVLARRLLKPRGDGIAIALAAQTPDPRKSPPTRLIDPAEVQVHRIVGVLFDYIPPPRSRHEAVEITQAPALAKIEAAYRVTNESALPLALPGQVVLGGGCLLPDQLDGREGSFVALTLTEGTSIFKRIGPKLPGDLAPLRQFESIGGLGESAIVAMEEIEGRFDHIPVMAFARLVVGVIYE